MVSLTLREDFEGLVRMYDFRFKNSDLPIQTNLKLINKNDVDLLVEIDEECFDDLYFEEDEFLRELAIPTNYGVILDRIVTGKRKAPVREGLAYIMGNPDTRNDVPKSQHDLEGAGSYLVSCAVMPVVRNLGIMKNMLKCYEEMSKLQELSHIRLHTRTEDNSEYDGALVIFQRLGFEISGRVDNHLDEGDHFYEMVKKIE